MIIIQILLSLNIGFASWNASTLKVFHKFQPAIDSVGFTDVYEASLWGAIKARSYYFNSEDTAQIDLPGVFKNPLPVSYSIQESFWSGTLKRPLIFYIPGIYNDVDAAQSKRAIAQFKKKGYHIVLFPNPWSKNYMTANPNAALPGNIFSEAASLRAAMNKTLQIIGEEYISHVELVGSSHGAFTAAIIQALDNKQDPLFSQTTLIGPPLDYRYTIPYLDQQMRDLDPEENDYGMLDTLSIGLDYLDASNRSEVSEENLALANAFTIKLGFKDELIDAITFYSKLHKRNWVPNFFSAESRAQWEENFVFSTYFERYATELKDLMASEYASLEYWLNESLNAGFQVRVLTSENDFLNPMSSPTKKALQAYPKEIFLSLPEGGHLGFLAFPWYQEFASNAWPDVNAN